MKAKKTKKKKKLQSCKYKDWERERRNRLNNQFLELNKVLPDYDPAITRKKCDIIRLAALYIQDLQDKNQQLIEQTDCNGLYANEISQMKNRISDLTHRCRQLVDLLRDSNIAVPAGLPPECIITKIKKPNKWSNLLKPETIDEFMKLIKKNKENKKKVDLEKICEGIDKQIKQTKGKVGNLKSKSSAVTSKLPLTNCTPSPPCSLTVNSSKGSETSVPLSPSVSSSCNSVVMPLRELNTAVINKSKTIKSSTVSKPTTVQSNSVSSLIFPSQTMKPNLITTTSNLVAAPIMATGIQTMPAVINRNASLQNLGPGTLILSDGRIVNVPPQNTPTVIAAGTTQFIVNRPVNPAPAVIVIPNSNVAQIINGKTVVSAATSKSVQRLSTQTKLIMPKLRKRDTTKTTFANKVPILASSSHHHSLVMSYKYNNSISGNKQSAKQHVQSSKNIVTKNSMKGSSKDIATKTQQNDRKPNQNSKMVAVSTHNEVKPDNTISKSTTIDSPDKSVDKNTNDSPDTLINKSISTSLDNNNHSGKKIVKDDMSLPIDQEIDNVLSEKHVDVQELISVPNVDIGDETDTALGTNNKRAFDKILDDTTCEPTNKKSKLFSSPPDTSKVVNKSLCENAAQDGFNVKQTVYSDTMQTVKVANKSEKYSIDALFCPDNDNIVLQQRDPDTQNDRSEKLVENIGFGDTKNQSNQKHPPLKDPSVKLNEPTATDGMLCKLDVNNFGTDTKAGDEKKPTYDVNSDLDIIKPIQKNNKIVEQDRLQSRVINAVDKETFPLSKPVDDNRYKNDNKFINSNFPEQSMHDVNTVSQLMTNVCPSTSVNNASSESNTTLYSVDSRANVVSNSVVLSKTTKNVTAEIANGTKTVQNTSFDCLNLNPNTNVLVDQRQATTVSNLDKVFQPIHTSATICMSSIEPVNKSNGNLPLNDATKGPVQRRENEIHKNKAVPPLSQSKSTNNTAYQCFIGSEQSGMVEDRKCALKNTSNMLVNNSKTYKNDSFLPTSSIQPLSNTNSCAALSSAPHSTKSSSDCNGSLTIENKDKNLFMPVNNHINCMDDVRLSIPNTEFSNDLFTSLQVPSGSQHPESLSPTAAFLLAFPLVSTSKTSEMLVDNDNSDSQHASPTILQIGSIEPNELYNNAATNVAIASNSTLRPTENIVGGHNGYNNNKSNDKLKESNLLVDQKSIESKVKPNQNKNVTGTLEFQDNRYGIDNMYLPTPESYYNSNMNNFNRSLFDYNQSANCAAVCSTSSSNNRNKPSSLVNNKIPNKIRDKQIQTRDLQHNQKDCLATLSNANTLQNNSSYLSSCDSDRKKHTIANANNIAPSSSNIRNSHAPSDSYILPIHEAASHHDNKMFDNKSAQFSSLQNASHSAISHQNIKNSVNSIPMSSAAISNNNGVINNKNYSMSGNFNKKSVENVQLLNSNGMPTCSFSQPISSACSVSLPSHSYSSYNLFTNCSGNDFPSNNNPSNSFVNKHQSNNSVDVKKCSSNTMNVISTSWSVPVINSNLNNSMPLSCNTSTTYSSTYQTASTVPSMHKSCSTQTSSKSLSSGSAVPNSSQASGNVCMSNENNIKTEKSNSFNPLPKFSTNFNFTPSNQHHMLGHQDILGYQPIASSSDAYKSEKPAKKSSTASKNSSSVSIRPPVNWMTTPDLRSSLHELPPSSIVPDMMFIASQKDIDFSAPNMSNCNNLPQYNIANTQPFYGLDMPLDLPPQFGDVPINKSAHRTSTVATSNQHTSHHYTWSPSKSSIPLLSHLDNHSLMIPSTLPTLVGDLALGTNTGPSTPAADSNIRHYNIPPPSLSLNSAMGVDNDNKSMRFGSSKNMNQTKTTRHEHSSAVQSHPQNNLKTNKIPNPGIEPSKEHSSKESTVNNANIRNNSICVNNTNSNTSEFCNSTKTHQSTNTTGSFLSVSQLVDHVKTEGRNAGVSTATSRKISKQTNSTQNNKNISNIPIQKQRSSANTQQNDIIKKSHSSKMSIGSHTHSGNFNNNNNNIHALNNRKSYAVDDINKHDQIVSNFLPSSVGSHQILLNENMSAPHWHCNSTTSNKDGSLPSSSSYKCGSYSAESLIGMNHDGTGTHDVMPSFSSTSSVHHQFNPPQQQIISHNSSHNYNHSHQKPFASIESSLLPVSSSVPTITSANCTTNIIQSDFHHSLPTNNIVSHQHHVNEFGTNSLNQNGLPHQQSVPSYQNCFNFTPSSTAQNASNYPSSNHHSVGVPYITDNTDYQIGCLDTTYLFGHPPANQPTMPHSSASNNLVNNMFSSNISSVSSKASTSISSVPAATSTVPIIPTSFNISTSVVSTSNGPTQHGHSVSNNTINKLSVNTSSATSQTSSSHKANRKRKDDVSNNNFSLVPPASLPTMHSSLSSAISNTPSATIYTSSYLHSTPHVSYSKPPVICDSIPPAIPSVLNPPMSSSYQAAVVTSCSTTPSGLGCTPLNNINHPSTTTLTNFNLSTIFPEINDKQRNSQGHATNYLTRDIGKHGFDMGNGNSSVRNHPEYLPPLRSEFNNVMPPQIGAPVNPPSLSARFPTDTFVPPSTFTSTQQNQ